MQGDPSTSDLVNIRIDLQFALAELPFIDQCVLFYRWILGESQNDVAEHLNRNQSIKVYNRVSVSMIEMRALAKLKRKLGGV